MHGKGTVQKDERKSKVRVCKVGAWPYFVLMLSHTAVTNFTPVSNPSL